MDWKPIVMAALGLALMLLGGYYVKLRKELKEAKDAAAKFIKHAAKALKDGKLSAKELADIMKNWADVVKESKDVIGIVKEIIVQIAWVRSVPKGRSKSERKRLFAQHRTD